MSEKQAVKKPGFFAGAKAFFKRIGKFFTDVKSELKKVVWPTRKQVVKNSAIVLSVVVIVGAFLFGIDSVMRLLLDLALSGNA